MLNRTSEELITLRQQIEENRGRDNGKMLDLALQLYDLGQKDGNEDVKALTSCILGDACCVNLDFSYAIHLLTEGINALIDMDEPELSCCCLNEIAVIFHHQGHYISAEESFVQCILLAREKKLYKYEAMACSNFASLCEEMDDYEDALLYYHRAEECFSLLEDKDARYRYMIGVLSYVMKIYTRMNNEFKVQTTYRQMETYIDATGEMKDSIEVAAVRLIYNHYIGNKEAELKAKEVALEKYYSCSNYTIYVDECIALFEYLLETECYDELEAAMEHFTQIAVCEDMANQFIHVQEIYMEMYKKTGDSEKLLVSTANYVEMLSKKATEAKKSFANTVKLQRELNQKRMENVMSQAEKSVDPLTKLPDKKQLGMVVDEMFDMAQKNCCDFCVEMFDVDQFKEINEKMGQESGDKVLEGIGDLLKNVVNKNIFAARYGADEFIILYYDMLEDDIISISKYLRKGAEEIGRKISDGKLTFSQGLVHRTPSAINKPWDFLSVADEALGMVKEKGGNNICIVDRRRSLKEAPKYIY